MNVTCLKLEAMSRGTEIERTDSVSRRVCFTKTDCRNDGVDAPCFDHNARVVWMTAASDVVCDADVKSDGRRTLPDCPTGAVEHSLECAVAY